MIGRVQRYVTLAWVLGALGRAATAYGAPPDLPVDAGVQAPVPIDLPAIPYPPGVDQGPQHVEVELTVQADGSVGDVKVSQGVDPFAALVVQAVRHTHFHPATEGGEPIAVVVPLTWDFPEPPVDVSGTLHRQGDGEPIADAVVIVGDRRGRTENAGHFALRNVAPGDYTVRLADTDLRLPDTRFTLAAGDSATLDLWASEESWSHEAVGVYRVAPSTGERVTLTHGDVALLPGSLGDPVRALQNAPGVVRTPLDAGWLLVRGGGPQDTGLFVDGVRVPLLFHLGGLTSILPPEMVDAIDFYPEAPPTRLGRSLSGAAEITSRKAGRDPRVVAGLNTAWAHAFVEAPVGPGASVAASVRRSWLDGVLSVALGPEQARIAPRFWDAQARVDGKHAGVLLLGLSDAAQVPNDDGTVADVTQQALQAQGHLVVRPGPLKLEIRPWLALHTQDIASDVRKETLTDLFPGLRVQLQGPEKGPVHWAAGVEAEQHTYRIVRDGDRRTTPFGFADPWAEARVGGKLQARVGLRLDTLFVQDQLPRFGLSPRAAVQWQATRDLTVIAQGGRYHQRPDTTFLAAFPDGPYLHLERSEGADLGVRYRHGPFTASIDGWSRWIDHIAMPELDGSMGEQLGRASGVETDLGLSVGHLDARLLYGFTRSLLQEEPLEATEAAYYDQPHRISALLTERLPRGWVVAGRWRYASGYPVPDGFTAYDLLRSTEVPIHRNAAGRSPAYHALDVKVSKRFSWRHWRLDTWLDVENVYNRRVPEPAINGIDETLRAYGVGLPILPLLGVQAQIWP